MDRPLISIVIANYNHARYLKQAIESCLNQSYPYVEVIVIDDGSTDDSRAVLSKYVDRIRVEYLQHVGVVQARNTGAQLVKGEYLSFLDADDYIESSFIEEHYLQLNKHPNYDFCYCDMRLTGAESGVVEGVHYSVLLLLYRNYISVSAVMKVKLFKDLGGFRSDFAELSHEDWDFWLLAAERNKCGIYLPKALYYWRKHHEGSRNTITKESLYLIASEMKVRHPVIYGKKIPIVGYALYRLDAWLGFLHIRFISNTVDNLMFGRPYAK